MTGEMRRAILLVEDDRVDVMQVERLLRRHGVDNPLRVAGDGEAALALLAEEGQPLLVICDIKMAPMDGLELLRRLKQDEELQHVPVVMLSGAREPGDQQRSERLGAAGHLVKPLTLAALIEVTAMARLRWGLKEAI